MAIPPPDETTNKEISSDQGASWLKEACQFALIRTFAATDSCVSVMATCVPETRMRGCQGGGQIFLVAGRGMDSISQCYPPSVSGLAVSQLDLSQPQNQGC